MTAPEHVAALLPVRDGERYIGEAIESLLAQEMDDAANLQIVIVDDASTDATAARIDSYEDRRITLIRRERSTGLADALNAGLACIKAPLVARLDADDRAAPDRSQRQREFLVDAPEVAVVGSTARLIDASGIPVGRRGGEATPAQIADRLRSRNALIHPSVMFRTQAVSAVGGYRRAAGRFEDYDLWLRLAATWDLATLPQALVDYRLHDGQLTTRRVAERPAIAAVGSSRLALARARGRSVTLARITQAAWAFHQYRTDRRRT